MNSHCSNMKNIINRSILQTKSIRFPLPLIHLCAPWPTHIPNGLSLPFFLFFKINLPKGQEFSDAAESHSYKEKMLQAVCLAGMAQEDENEEYDFDTNSTLVSQNKCFGSRFRLVFSFLFKLFSLFVSKQNTSQGDCWFWVGRQEWVREGYHPRPKVHGECVYVTSQVRPRGPVP